MAKWKFGLRIAILMGLCQAVMTGVIYPNSTSGQISLVILTSVAAQVIAYIKKHPPEKIGVVPMATDTQFVAKTDSQPKEPNV